MKIAEANTDNKMSNNQDDISQGINKAWAAFTEDAEKAKEAMLSAINEDLDREDDEKVGVRLVIIYPVGALVLVFILVAFLIYICVSANKNKKTD